MFGRSLKLDPPRFFLVLVVFPVGNRQRPLLWFVTVVVQQENSSKSRGFQKPNIRKGAEWQKALAFLSFALDLSMQATVVTYSSAITACERGKKWKEALRGRIFGS